MGRFVTTVSVLRRLAPFVALLAAAAALADVPDVTGRFGLEGGATLAITRSGDQVQLERTAGGEQLRGQSGVSEAGWVGARFGVVGLADGVAGAGGVPGGTGLYQVLPDGAVHGFRVDAAGLRTFEHGRRDGTSASYHGGFARHLREAIALNTARRDDYAARSGGASRSVSRLLVLLERATVVWAWFMDWRAKRWVKRGAPVVHADFVSMAHVAPATRPPRWTGRATDAQWDQLDRLLDGWRDGYVADVDAGRWEPAAGRTVDALAEVERLEAAWGCHLAMTRHTLEQAGWAALNAPVWSRASQGGTDDLARTFVKTLKWGVVRAPGIDRRAQAAHAAGVGVVVNDVPEIPLTAAWNLRR